MKDILISTGIILGVVMVAVVAERLLMPVTSDVAGFAARHLVSPAALVLHGQIWRPAIWL